MRLPPPPEFVDKIPIIGGKAAKVWREYADKGSEVDRFGRWRLAQGWGHAPITSMTLIAVMDRAAPSVAQAGKIAFQTRIANSRASPWIHLPIHIIATSTGPHAVSRMFPMA